MHLEVLEKEQIDILPIIKEFKDKFYLVGGTALALQIGHRKSIDFDLFNNSELKINRIRKKLDTSKIQRVLVNNEDQYTIAYNNVNLTFFNYPFNIKPTVNLNNVIESVDVLTIGAMKAFALSRRSKWKDYVDLYFILQKYSLEDLFKKSKAIYKNQFNDKLFLEQLCYFEDIDFSQNVVFVDKEVDFDTIKDFLIQTALSYKP